jgi:cytochrome P450 / NADPH-cytochrome P450 reductase
MARYTTDPQQRDELLGLSTLDDEGRERYRKRVAARRSTILDLLDEFPACELPFNVYLDLLPPLRPRYYSISSSPSTSATCDITVGVLQGPARSGDGIFTGVCSGHLTLSGSDSTVFVFVRKPTIPFRPPENPHVPMIMVGAGTGMAPFRGFLQERAGMKERGVPVAESLLYYGCRNPDVDFLYSEELQAFEKAGVARLRMAFSRAPEDGRRYVQHVIAADADQVWDLLEQGAVVYVCGNASTMAPGVRAALTDVYRAKTGASEAAGETWLAGLRAEQRYLEDIWGEKAIG